MLNKKTIKSERLLRVLLFFLLLFNNETLANNLCMFIEQPAKYVAALAVAYFVVYHIAIKGIYHHFNAAAFVGLVILLTSVCLALVRDIGFTNGYVLVLLAILSGLSIALSVDYNMFERIFLEYIVVLATVSLVCTYLVKPVVAMFGSLFPIVVNSAGVGFYNMHLCYVAINERQIRNFGIFREPGVYAIFLIVAIIFLINNKERLEKKKYLGYLVVLLVTLVSTFSTTGFLALFVVLFWGVVAKKQLNFKQLILSVVLITGVMGLSESEIANPLTKLDAEHSSFQTRMESLKIGLQMAASSVLGRGILAGNMQMSANYSLRSYHVINTFATMGVFWGLSFMITWLIGVGRFCSRRLNSKLLLFPILLLLSGELLIYNPLIYILMFYGFTGDCGHAGEYEEKMLSGGSI